MTSKSSKNLFKFDNDFEVPIIIGTDEAGRGPGAGGVFASAVCFKNVDKFLIDKLSLLNDSKKISKKTREELFEIITQNSFNATVCIEVEEIEKINILNASLEAMKLACETVIEEARMQRGKDAKESLLILVDGNKLIKNSTFQPFNRSTLQPETIYQKFIIKGDSQSASIAAASILAKVSRDFYMQKLDEKYPNYNWKSNAGYLTREHLGAIDRYGITPHHRCSFLKNHYTKKQEEKELQESNI